MAFGSNLGRSLKLYLQGDTSDLEKALARAQYKIQRFHKGAGGAGLASSGIGGSGSLLAVGARVGVAGAAAAAAGAALGSAVKQAISFDTALRNVNTIAKLSENQLSALGAQLRSMSGDVNQGPTELANGLYDIVSSGFKASDAVKVLEASAKAASAGMTDTATASRALVAVLNAYHLSASDASHVSDVLFQEVNLGVNTFGDLANNLGDVVPQASALRIPFEQIAAALALITKSGTSMSEASTQVSRVLTAMIKPTASLKAEFKAMGFTSGQAAVEALGFTGVLQRLSKDANGNQQKIAAWLGEIRGIRGVLNLTGANMVEYTKFVKQMGDASENGGAAQKAFEEQSKGVGFQLHRLRVESEAAAAGFGQKMLPAIKGTTYVLQEFADDTNRSKLSLQDVVKQGDQISKTFGMAAAKMVEFAVRTERAAQSAKMALEFAQQYQGLNLNPSGRPDLLNPSASTPEAVKPRIPGPEPPKTAAERRKEQQRIIRRNTIFDNDISRRINAANRLGTVHGVFDSGTTAGQVKGYNADAAAAQAQKQALQGIAADLKKRLAKTHDATRRLNLKAQIDDINDQMRSLDDRIRSDLQSRADAIQQALTQTPAALKLKEANALATKSLDDNLKVYRQELSVLRSNLGKAASAEVRAQIREAMNAVTSNIQSVYEAMQQAAEAFKSKALDRLSRMQQKLTVDNDLRKARDAYKQALIVGAPGATREALFNLRVAKLQQQQNRLETATVKPSGSGYTIVMNGVTIQANNVNQLIAQLTKMAKSGAPQSRGRAPGNAMGFGWAIPNG